MIKSLIIISFLSFSLVPDVNSAEGGPCKDYGDCDQFKPDLNNMASLQRGVGTFMKYCYSCHSLKYSRWGRVANLINLADSYRVTGNLDRARELAEKALDLEPENPSAKKLSDLIRSAAQA